MSRLRQPVTPQMAVVVVLALVYAVLLPALIVTARKEAALVPPTAAAEAAVRQASATVQNSAPALRATLAAAKERLATLQARVPADVQADFFERVAQDAQSSGITEFRYQRKGEFQETLQAGVFKVYRFSISGRGTQDKVAAFLDSLHKDSGQAIVENVSVSAAGNEWKLSADIIVYTWGG